VIDRIKRCVWCVLVLCIHLFLTPITTNAAAVFQPGDVSPASAPSGNQGSAILRVELAVERKDVTPGEFINYELTVANSTRSEAASDTRILTMLPGGFRYKSGSAQLNGIGCPDPSVSADGQSMVFLVGNLAPEHSATVSFLSEVTAVSKSSRAVSYASAISRGGGNSNIAIATVQVRHNTLRTKADLSESPQIAAIAATASVVPQETPRSSAVQTPEITAPASVDTSVSAQAASAAENVPAQEASPSSAPVTAPDSAKSPANGVDTGVAASPTENLAGLAGMSDISVLSDADGLFVQNMAKNQIVENESAGLVTETNLLASIYAGRNFSRDSHAASARTEQAKAQTGQALALLLPSVAVRANYGLEISDPSVAIDKDTGRPISSDMHSRTDASLTVRQSLFDLPSFRDWQRRKVIEQARGENYRVSDGDTYISTANAYLSLVSSRLQVDMTRDFETQLADLLSYIEKRASAGAASVSDMARVRARRQATLSSRLEQESAHAAAGIEFVRLTNIVPKRIRIPVPDDIGASQLPKTLDVAVTTAMKSNPEIASLNAEIEAATIDKTAAKARYLPRVDAEYSNNYSLHAGGSTSSAGQKDQRLMMVLNWSLYSGGADYQNHVERTARHKELQYRLDDQRRRVVQTLSANYATLATTRERITSGYQELKSISTAAEAMSKRMLSGNQSLLDLLDVYDRFYQVRSRLVTLHILEMNTVAQLVRLTLGTPDPASEAKPQQSVIR